MLWMLLLSFVLVSVLRLKGKVIAIQWFLLTGNNSKWYWIWFLASAKVAAVSAKIYQPSNHYGCYVYSGHWKQSNVYPNWKLYSTASSIRWKTSSIFWLFIFCSNSYLLSLVYNYSMESFSTARMVANVMLKIVGTCFVHFSNANVISLAKISNNILILAVHISNLKTMTLYLTKPNGNGSRDAFTMTMSQLQCWPFLPFRLAKDGLSE